MSAAPDEEQLDDEFHIQGQRNKSGPVEDFAADLAADLAADVLTGTREDTRVFDRIRVSGTLHFEGFDYPINDLSVGGLSVEGAVQGWQLDEIRQAEFLIQHGNLEVRGQVNCRCLNNPQDGITRFKLVEPSEDLTEFFRAVTLRSGSGADYDVSWLPEKSSNLKETKNKRPATLASRLFSLPMLVFTMFMVLLAAFAIRQTSGDARWVMYTHEIIAPVTGQITSLGTGSFNVGETLTEITAMTINGNDLMFALKADVAAVAVDWRFSTGDRVTADDVLGHLLNVPQNEDRFFAIVTLQIPFLRFKPGDRVVLASVDGTRIVGDLRRILTRNEQRNQATSNSHFAPGERSALVEFQGESVDFTAAPEVRILETVFENAFR